MKINLIALSTLLLMGGCNTSEQENKTGSQEVIADTTSAIISTDQEFSKKITFKRFSFSIQTAGDSANRGYTLTPSGYSISNDPITEKTKGTVTDFIVGDIDGDENPEVAVIISSGEKQEGEAIVYSSNKDRSISRVNFPSTIADSVLSGYSGHDEFMFVGKNFVRRFPTGTSKLRHMQYRLVKGEAGKQMVLRHVIDL